MKTPRITPLVFFLCILTFAIVNCSYAQSYRLNKTFNEHKSSIASQYILSATQEYVYDRNTNRGSTYNADYIAYDSTYNYSGTTMPNYTRTRTYNNDNTINTEMYWKYLSGPNVTSLQKIDTFVYDTKGRVVLHRIYNVSAPPPPVGKYVIQAEHIYTYDAQGNMLTKSTSAYNFSTQQVEPSTKEFYWYNSSNELINWTLSRFKNGTFSTERSTTYTYTNGKLFLEEDFQYFFGTPNLSGAKYYYYNSAGLLAIDSVKTRLPHNGKAEPYITTYTYNGKGLLVKDSVYRGIGLSIYQAVVTSYSYTAFDYYDKTESVTNNIGTTTYSFNRRSYRYDADPVNIATLQEASTNLQLYPVPASNSITIQWENENRGLLQGRIMNLKGQTVQQWSEPMHSHYHKQVNTSQLPAGNYYLELRTKEDVVKKQFVIIK